MTDFVTGDFTVDEVVEAMQHPRLTVEDREFILVWRRKQPVPCLAFAVRQFAWTVQAFCDAEGLKGP